MYNPKEPFSTTLEHLNPTYQTKLGVTTKTYVPEGFINCSFKTYGGTESNINDVYSVIDTAMVETWYNPRITSASRFILDSKVYEVVGEPEDISFRHQFMKFKVRGINGGA